MFRFNKFTYYKFKVRYEALSFKKNIIVLFYPEKEFYTAEEMKNYFALFEPIWEVAKFSLVAD